MKAYLRILRDVDKWYRSVRERHPDKVTCTRGCRDCCLGLFDVSIADRDLLRAGLAAADPETCRDIRERAAVIVAKLRAEFPGLGATLEGLDDSEVDRLCDHLGDVECPVLGREGECRLYEHRPLTCRLAGVPVVDRTGDVIQPEGCSKCTLKAADAPRLDCRSLRRRERRLLERMDPDGADATMLIPQVFA